jgi:phosphoribosylformylglycinamidine cyclo-ligase
MDYSAAGVNIEAADAAKERIKALARGTFNPAVLSEIGSFGGMFRPDFARYREPVLVASTDGVGTKIQVAILAGIHDTVGYDLVAHCVNDILVQGALPLFFLDYIALGKMDVERVEAIVRGFSRGCAEFGCPLIGGETAEMPGTYAPHDYDLAGFIVGVVEKSKALTGDRVREGDLLVGLPSAGLHTNGYTLARKVLLEVWGTASTPLSPSSGPRWGPPSLPRTAATCRRSNRSSSATRSTLSSTSPAAVSRGTSRGCCPEGLGAVVRTGAWTVPPLFRLIQKGGAVGDEEMLRTFNMGIGMIAVVGPADLHEVEHSLERRGETSFVIGSVVRGTGVAFE